MAVEVYTVTVVVPVVAVMRLVAVGELTDLFVSENVIPYLKGNLTSDRIGENSGSACINSCRYNRSGCEALAEQI